jgi:hypothetical protein
MQKEKELTYIYMHETFFQLLQNLLLALCSTGSKAVCGCIYIVRQFEFWPGINICLHQVYGITFIFILILHNIKNIRKLHNKQYFNKQKLHNYIIRSIVKIN